MFFYFTLYKYNLDTNFESLYTYTNIGLYITYNNVVTLCTNKYVSLVGGCSQGHPRRCCHLWTASWTQRRTLMVLARGAVCRWCLSYYPPLYQVGDETEWWWMLGVRQGGALALGHWWHGAMSQHCPTPGIITACYGSACTPSYSLAPGSPPIQPLCMPLPLRVALCTHHETTDLCDCSCWEKNYQDHRDDCQFPVFTGMYSQPISQKPSSTRCVPRCTVERWNLELICRIFWAGSGRE